MSSKGVEGGAHNILKLEDVFLLFPLSPLPSREKLYGLLGLGITGWVGPLLILGLRITSGAGDYRNGEAARGGLRTGNC